MKDESARDKAIENVLGQKLRARSTAGNGCPDSEIVAAYFERTLPPGERSRWEAHFDTCAACQQRIAALVRMDEAGEASLHHAPVKAAAQPRKASALRWAWTAPVLLVVLVAGLWYTGEFDKVLNRHGEIGAPAPQPVASAPKPAEAPATAGKDASKISTEEPKGEALHLQSTAKAPAKTASTDERKQAANAPAPASAAAEGAATQAPMTPPPPAAKDIAAARRAKEGEAASASTGPGLVGPPPARLEAAQAPSAPLANRQEVAKPDSEAATSAGAAGLRAIPSAAPTETSAMKKSMAAVAAGNEVPSNRQDTTQSSSAKMSFSSQLAGIRAKSRAPGFFYTQAPSQFVQDVVASPAVLWRVGPDGLIQRQGAEDKWFTVPSGVSADLYAIGFSSHEVGWAVGQDGTVLRSANGGESWGRVTSPTDEDLVRVRATSAESAEVTTRGGVVFATTDGAATWTRVETAR